MIDRRQWRDRVLVFGLERRLQIAGCPLTLDEIVDTQSLRNVALAAWARASLAEGVMLRTAQSELLSRGESLEKIASTTGIRVDHVLYELTRFESEFDEKVGEFYYRPSEL